MTECIIYILLKYPVSCRACQAVPEKVKMRTVEKMNSHKNIDLHFSSQDRSDGKENSSENTLINSTTYCCNRTCENSNHRTFLVIQATMIE